MAEVYYYVPEKDVDNAVECGLKLSKWFDKEVLIDGDKKQCLSAFLNPKDDMKKYKSTELKCLKLEMPPRYCFVADAYLYQIGLGSPKAMEMYLKSIIPLDKYLFGSYRMPECLVTATAITGQVSILDKRLDSPVLFNNSEELYINNIIETFIEQHPDFNDSALYAFFSRLAEIKRLVKIEDDDKKLAVFIDERNEKTYTIKISDITDY